MRLIAMKMKIIIKDRSYDLIDRDVDMDTNIQSIAGLGKIVSTSNKQHLSNI